MADTKYAGNKQMTDLRDRIATALAEAQEAHNGLSDLELADAVIRELNIPDRTHVDDEGRVWEWCGGEPGTWAWRITRLHKREKWDCSQSDWSADDD